MSAHGRSLLGLGLLLSTVAGAQDRLPPRRRVVTAPPANESTRAAQVPVSRPEVAPVRAREKSSRTLRWNSAKIWRTSRWYVVGRIERDATVRWLDGQVSPVSWEQRCSRNILQSATAGEVQIERGPQGPDGLEVLRSGDWLAIEVNPAYLTEEFKVGIKSGTGDVLCSGTLNLSYIWDAGRGNARPLLFVSANDNLYYGHQLSINSDDLEERADVQIDLLLGISSNSFPNASGAAKKSLIFAPNAIARGEWLIPSLNSWGMFGSLRQRVASFGGAANQDALYSDWSTRLFYQRFLRWKDGLQLRASLGFLQHLADDNRDLPTVSVINRKAQYFVASMLAQLYFSRRWFMGLEMQYGLPNQMAGRGTTQSYLGGLTRIGIRATPSMFLIGELEYQTYQAKGISAETQLGAQFGLRLEL